METGILLNLLDAEATNLQASNPGLSGLLYSASAKIKALDAHQPTPEASKGYSLEDVARLKRELEAGRGPSLVGAEIGIPALRFG